MILGVDDFAVGIAGAVGDPGAIRGEEHGLKGGDQAAGGNDHLHVAITAVAVDVHVRLTIGDYEERFVLQFIAQTDAQALSGP